MVLDASGAIELLLNTAAGQRLALRLRDESEFIHVPHLIDVEIAQVLRRYVRHGMLDEGRGARALERWRRLDAERYSHEPFLERVWQLRDNISAYDAVYVALAEALSTALGTGDRRLAAAPGVNVAIEVI